MEKANVNGDVIVARFFNFSPEELVQIAKRMELASKERANPKEKLMYEAAPGLFFVHDPRVTRGDLERTTRLSARMPEALEQPALPT